MRAKARRNIRSGFETAGMRIGLAVVPRLPRSWVVRLARWMGAAVYAVGGRMRRVGEANLALALGDRHSAEQRAAILKRSFQTLALTALDVLWFSRAPEKRIPAWMDFEPDLDRMLSGPAKILITGHHGNWEVLGQAVTLRGHPLASVAMPLANPAVDRLLIQARSRSGQTIVPRKRALIRLLKRIRDGGKVALVLDQNTLPREGGVFVSFFGRAVPVSQAPALLALRTGAPIGFGWAWPEPDGRYRCTTAETIDPGDFGDQPTAEAVKTLTQAVTARLEEAVRRQPAEWGWMYKRWKHIPPDASPEAYPFYARPLGARGKKGDTSYPCSPRES